MVIQKKIRDFFPDLSRLIGRSEDGLSIDIKFNLVGDNFDTSEATKLNVH